MGKFNDELIPAGVLVAAEGLDDAKEGVVVDYSSQPPVVDRRAVRRDQGAVRRLLHPRRRLEGGGRRVGQAGAADRPGHEDRDPPGAEHRRVPAGQRVDPEGAGVAGGDRPALTRPARTAWWLRRPPGGRGGVADRVGPDRRRARPLHRRLRAGRGPRPGGARRGARLLAARRRARATRPAGCSPSAGGGRSTRSGAGPRSTSGTPRSRATWTRARPPRARRPTREEDAVLSTPTGSTTTCSR